MQDLTIRELRHLIKRVKKVKELHVFKKEIDDCEDLILDIQVHIENIISKKKIEREFQTKRDEERLQRMEGKTIREIETESKEKDSAVLKLTIDFEKLGNNIDNLWDQLEEELLRVTLSYFNGNRTKACRAMGISIRTVRNKLHKYNQEGRVVDYVSFNPRSKVAQNSTRF